jgi:uroporphyrinogen decarboxylase
MYTCPELWTGLMQRLADSVVGYLERQIEAGCQAVQVFDTWAGCLSPSDYQQYALPYSKRIFDLLPAQVPAIHFLTGNPALLPLQREAGGSIIGLDWRVDLGDAWKHLGYDTAVQGNLDPVVLQADLATLKSQTRAVMDSAGGRPGHIFNLGHGVLPETNPEHAKALVAMVHEMGAARP